jgi:hypothetical protein
VTATGMAATTDTFVPGAAEAGQPRIDQFQPTAGDVGTQVTITGSGLAGATEAQFAGVSTPVTGYRIPSCGWWCLRERLPGRLRSGLVAHP